MNTFISYASDIKVTAGKIKKYLDCFGFNCFLAHEDIPPQTVWPSEIIKKLKQCDLFLPLITPKFIESYYCQQEVGFAYCRRVEILPIMVLKAPIGMIADMQGVKFNRDKFDSSCWKIVSHVAKNDSISESVLDALITWFGESDSYGTANERARSILNEFDFTPHQVTQIKQHIKNNSQIHGTKDARDSIFKFFNKYSSSFDKEFKDWYDSKKASRMWLKY